MRRLRKVRSVDIRDEPECHAPLAVMLERFISHHRPEIGSANANVDDVANPLPRVSFPGSAPDTGGTIGHLVEHRMDLRHHVLAVDQNRGSFRSAESHVQNSSLFRHIDFFPAEHRLDARPQA